MVYDLFSEGIERRLFTHPLLFHPAEDLRGVKHRVHDHQLNLLVQGVFPPEVFAVINAARDSGLDPDIITHDYCLYVRTCVRGGLVGLGWAGACLAA